jgi:hypothetical protein
MAEPENIVLEHLRHIRGVVDATRDDVADLKSRIAMPHARTRDDGRGALVHRLFRLAA